jgi:NTP pyrophosphatase (non-canonical NTP hydrolase)
LGDLQFAITCIANYYKIDLVDALMKTMKKYFKRDSIRFLE